MEKIAILSDIHGTVTALEAVLEDAKVQGATEYWLLGDVFLPGPGTDRIIELLRDLPLTVNIRGNWDDVMLTMKDRKAQGRVMAEKPEHLALYRQGQYLLENLSSEGFAFLDQQTATAKVVKSGLTFQLSHNFPDCNHGGGLYWQSDQEQFDRLCEDLAVDVAVYGHVHVQTMRYSSKGQLILNPGSIGQPYWTWDKHRQDLRAQYALLTLDEQGIAGLDFRKVAFDVTKELVLAEQAGQPYLELYRELLETGILHTHNNELLADYNDRYGYVQEVKDYFTKTED